MEIYATGRKFFYWLELEIQSGNTKIEEKIGEDEIKEFRQKLQDVGGIVTGKHKFP